MNGCVYEKAEWTVLLAVWCVGKTSHMWIAVGHQRVSHTRSISRVAARGKFLDQDRHTL